MNRYRHRTDRMVIDPDGDYVHKFDVRKLQAELEKHEGLSQRIVELKGEAEKLKEFARKVIDDVCWSAYTLDGGEIQEFAEKLDLIKPHTATEEDVDESDDFENDRCFGVFEVGDIIYKFTALLEEKND